MRSPGLLSDMTRSATSNALASHRSGSKLTPGPRAIEIYRNHLILYGCGDFLNDYEGIRGYERYRDDLALMYFADLDPASGSLHALRLVPLQIKNFCLSNQSLLNLE